MGPSAHDVDSARHTHKADGAHETQHPQPRAYGVDNAQQTHKADGKHESRHRKPNAFNYSQFIPDYAQFQDVKKYIKFAQFMQNSTVPASAADCKTMEELDAWRKVNEAPIKQFVPKMWQDDSLAPLEKEYEQNSNRIKEAEEVGQKGKAVTLLARLRASHVQPAFDWNANEVMPTGAQRPRDSDRNVYVPASYGATGVQKYVPSYANYMDVHKFVALAELVKEQHAPEKADDCKTMKELDAWFAKQKAVIKSYVPAAYAKYPLKSLEKMYSQNKERVQHATGSNATMPKQSSSKELQTDTETRASINASITNKTATEQLAAADAPLIAQIMTCSAIAMVA